MNHLDDQPHVTLLCRDDTSVGVRFGDRSAPDGYCVQYAVDLWAPGMTARLDGAVAWVRGSDLAPFLAGLAEDFRGWDGERTWQTHDGDLTVTAVHRSGGHTGLTWTLRPWRLSAGGWSASATTWLEAGEGMRSFAADIGHFLAWEPAHP
ncbi:DUF6228 family protein [Streptomyces sp. 2P-4]|uniref:DUF6228 family protein n=1 Tax=Streptomyces sp. 2P-4 TaxID=2931974 RepID=UPI0025422110|nr:DUF6228 family protein [Streptomyces sp. 2P-4]